MVAFALLLLLGQVPTVPAKDFAKEVQQRAVTATVRIANVTEGTDGSGVLLRHEGPFAYILTANHVIGKGKMFNVHVFTADSYPQTAKVYKGASVLARDARADLAVLRIVTREVLPSPVAICPLKMTPVGKDFAVLTVGCQPMGPPTPLEDVVKEINLVSKPGESGKAKCWVTATAQVKGRSGGPLIDRQGRLIGVASGVSGGKGYYLHIEEIHAFLKRQALDRLAEEAK